MQVCFTGSAQPVICCETVRRQKQNCTEATLRCWKAVFSIGRKRPQMRNIAIFLGLQAHSEIVTVKNSIPILSFLAHRSDERKWTDPVSAGSCQATIRHISGTQRCLGIWYPGDVFYLSGVGIYSVVRRLIIAVIVITRYGRAGSCSLVKPLCTRYSGWRRRRFRYVDRPFSGRLPLLSLLRSLSPRRWSLRRSRWIRRRSWLLCT